MRKVILRFFAVCAVAVAFACGQMDNIIYVYASEETLKGDVAKETQENYYQDYYDALSEEINPYVEMCQKCRIDESILTDMSNEELLELVFSFPLYYVFYLQDTEDDGFEELVDKCDALRVLTKRDGYIDTFSRAFLFLDIPESTRIDYDNLIDKENYTESLTELVTNDEYEDGIFEDAQIIFKFKLCNYIMRKALKLDPMSLCYDISELLADKYDDLSQSDYCTQVVGNNAAKATLRSISSEITISSPSGNEIVLQYTGGVAISDAQVAALLDAPEYEYMLQNGYMEVQANGTTAYNCHAFAWFSELSGYQQYAYNYSLNDVSPLIEDRKCRKSSVAKLNWIGNSASHSVIVKAVSYQWRNKINNLITEPYVLSKWGNGGPLIKCPLSICPYDMSGINYYHFK